MQKNNNLCPRCGEIWMCNLTSRGKSIQRGYRPVFVYSNNKNNTFSPTLNVIPISSKIRKRKLPVHVELESYQKYGLRVPSVMLIEQFTTINLDNLDRKIGEVNDIGTLRNIREAIFVQFPLLSIM